MTLACRDDRAGMVQVGREKWLGAGDDGIGKLRCQASEDKGGLQEIPRLPIDAAPAPLPPRACPLER